MKMSVGKNVYWSLLQATAWLMFQTEESASIMEGAEHPSETRLILWNEVKKITPYYTEENAKQTLLRALQSGNLIAYGQKARNQPSEEVPALHWKDLQFGFGRRGSNTASLEPLSNVSPDWCSVAFLREDIKRLFPSRNEKRKGTKNKNVAQSPFITQRQRAWAAQYYYDLQVKGIYTNRDQDFAVFRKEFPTVARDTVRQLRQEMAPELCKPGRRSLKNLIA